MAGTDRTGDDPTRTEPGGSGTTTKITEQSEMGSDRASDEGSREEAPSRKPAREGG